MVLWSKTSYSGDERRCHYAGRTNDDERTSEDRVTQPMEAGGWVSQFYILPGSMGAKYILVLYMWGYK